MARIRKIGLILTALLLALALGFGLASCGGKDTTPTYGYGEEGTYYCLASDGSEFLLSLQKGTAIQSYDGGGSTASYAYDADEGLFVFTEEGEDMATGSLSEAGLTVTYNGRSYLFLTYEYYTVSFMDGGTTLSTQSVLNGRAAQDPGEPDKEGYVFLGWYADASYTTRYEFNTSVTSDTTVYARFYEMDEGVTEYTVTFDLGDGETYTTETFNGKAYYPYEPERSGFEFVGWWVSATNRADELTYRYEGETLYEDTTLFAVFVSGSYVGASVRGDGIYWENYDNTSTLTISIADESGEGIERFDVQSTSEKFSYDFTALPAGKYTVSITGSGISETLVYVSRGLARVSGFTVISGSILMYEPVENAERYYISIECGNENHDHAFIDNGSSLYYDFSSCEMGPDGITFTVCAYAEGYYRSVSSYDYFLGLGKTAVIVEGDVARWDKVENALEYEVYVNGALVATVSGTEYDLSAYPAGNIEVSVRPVTKGYWSETGASFTYTKTTLAAPRITNIENYTITWTEVEGATGYVVRIGDTETLVDTCTSLILSDDNYTAGLDLYGISVKALASDSKNDSPYGETVTVTGTGVGSAVSYENGTVTWQYSLSASEYRITVNDGDELVITGTNSSPVTLTKSGNNEITVYFVNEDGDIYGTASVTAYAYAIVFDARGGAVYDADGNEIETIYVAKGDTVTLPVPEYGTATADFLGWYTLPVTTDNPDATEYEGDGVRYDDFVFTGSGTMVLYAAWVNPRMIVTLDPAGGTLTDGDGNAITETAISLNGRNYSVAVPEAGDAVYAFYGWYSGSDGTGTRYTDEMGNAYAPFSDETVTTLYACWIQVLIITSASYNNTSSADNVFSVTKGPDIGLVSEVTIPESYTVGGVEYKQGIIIGTAFSALDSLKTINIPDTIVYIQMSGNGFDSGTNAFSGTALENVNVYATGEPSTTKEVTYYSNDGVLCQKTYTGGAELVYYPYGRTDETYEIPATVSNENEYEYVGTAESHVTRQVDTIAASVFRGHTELVRMTIPEYITTVGTYAFYGCASLERVWFEADVAEIGDSMFRGCVSLTGLDMPDSVREIGTYAFYGSGVESVYIPDSVTVMGTYAFAACASLETVRLSASCAVINDREFYQCTALKTVEIPSGVTAINQYAFYGCTSMTGAAFSYGLTSIGNYAFQNCASLVEAVMPDSLTSLGTNCFDGCSSLESVTLSSSLTSLGNYDFQNCTALKSVTVPEGVTTIGNYCFYQCYSLSEVNLPDSLTAINQNAFNSCYSLTSITIPKGLTSSSAIGTSAFRYCYKLVEIRDESSLGISVTTGSTNGYIGSNALNVYTPTSGSSKIKDDANGFRFYVGTGSERYLLGYYGSERYVTLPYSVDGDGYEVYAYAFYYDKDLYGLTVSSGVTSIGEKAFAECTNLASVSIGQCVESIGTDAFEDCYKLAEVCNLTSMEMKAGDSAYGGIALYAKSVYTYAGGSMMTEKDGFKFVRDDEGGYFLVGYYGSDTDVVLPDDIDGNAYAVYDYAFYGNKRIKSVTVPGSVTRVGDYAFRDCLALLNVTLAGGVAEIGESAFYNCQALVSVTLGEGLETIGDYAFYGCASLREISVPDSVTYVGNSCFYKCSSLRSVAIGSSVETIGTYAFYQCVSLGEIAIPDSVVRLGDSVFYGCTSLTAATIGDGTAAVGSNAFYGCSSLRRAVLGTGVETIETQAFYQCQALESVNIPDGVASIGMRAFYECYALRSISIPGSVTDMGTYCFAYCTFLSGVTFGSGLGAVGDYMFYECPNIKEVSIPDSVTEIGQYAFYDCESLASVAMGNGVTSIGSYAFRGCTSLESVALPDSLTALNSYAFYGCTGLKSVAIPDAVTTIGDYALWGCTDLTDITVGGNVSSFGRNVLVNTGYYDDPSNWEDGILYLGAYYIAAVDSSVSGDLTIRDGTTLICNYAFQNRSAVTGITFPESLMYIGNYAFDGCGSIVSVVLPDLVAGIGNYVFRNCTSLESIAFGDGIASIGNYAFNGCSKLKSIVLPDSLTSIGTNAFQSCSALESVTFGDNLQSIGNYAFEACSSLTCVVIPDSVTSLGTYAFRNCTMLSDVTIGSGIDTIGSYTFSACTSLERIVIPDNVTSLGTYAFYNSSNLTEVVIGSGMASIGGSAFNGCSKLSAVYYNGTESMWGDINIGSSNTNLTNAALYCYSETEPASDGDFWHWADGEVVVWKKD